MPVKKDAKEIAASEIFSMTGGLLAGLMLTFVTDKLSLVPGLLILIPGFLEMRGNISGSLSARLSAGLFVGSLKPRLEKNPILRHNILASFTLVIALSFSLGLVATGAFYIFFGKFNFDLIFVALVAGILSNVIEIPLTIATTFYLFRHGHDPNNIMGPYITTTGDIISIISLLFAISVV